MLAKRIIPTLLCRGRELVKGKQFNSWRSVGVAIQAVKINDTRGVDELILLDITATRENRGPDLGLVEELTRECLIPLCIGGGVKDAECARKMLKAGADKVSVGTAGLKAIKSIADKFGSQAVVASIDVCGGRLAINNGQTLTLQKPVEYAQACVAHGAGEILLTSVRHEGMMKGYDLELIHEVSESVSVPVIAHGGCGTYEHMLQAIKAGADAVAAGAMFQFSDATPLGAARYLKSRGIDVRICA